MAKNILWKIKKTNALVSMSKIVLREKAGNIRSKTRQPESSEEIYQNWETGGSKGRFGSSEGETGPNINVHNTFLWHPGRYIDILYASD